MSKKCMIFETLNDVKSLKTKTTSEGLMQLSGVFGVCGVRNNNQRVYEKNNYAAMVTEMQRRIKEAPILGELEHPATMNITLENVSHKIDKIEIDENGVVTGTITLLNTPKGKIAQAIVEGGAPLFISSRAQGNVDRNGNVQLETLQTYDLVGSPGFSQAKLKLDENQCVESLCESIFYVTEKDNEDDNNENNGTNEDMSEEQFNKINERLTALENENKQLKKQIEESEKRLADGVEMYLREEFSAEIDKWISESVLPEVGKGVDMTKLGNAIQEWIVNEYSPIVEHWAKTELATGINQWINEHFAEQLQTWIIEEYSPEIQKWVAEEYSEGLQSWIIEHLAPEIQNWVTEHVNESISANATKSNTTTLDSIKEALEVIDQKQKPTYSRQVLNESMKVNEESPAFIREMPLEYRAKWDMASANVKESICRKARLYNFNVAGAIQHFWENVNFEDNTPKVNETKTVTMDAKSKAILESWKRKF